MELQRDYQKFLQHRGLPEWHHDHPALVRFKALRCNSLDQFRAWVAEEVKRASIEQGNTDAHRRAPGETNAGQGSAGQCSPVSKQNLPAVCAANGALSLLNLCVHLVRRQLESQAAAFEKEGGFTERLYRVRQARRRTE
jgi:four helix bundle suffix protein